MAIADTITSMQNHTSNSYTMIGYGTDLTGINKNLENLSTSIFNAFLEALRNPDTLFTNLPKKSGTGANITLNDTANAPMRIELGASELTQDGTPTPETPYDIHTISGSNKIVVNGKNLFNPANNEWGKFNVWQNNTGVFANSFTNTFNVKGGETCSITIICNRTNGVRSSYQFIDDNNNFLSGVYWSIGTQNKVFENVSIPATATKCIISQLDASQSEDIKIQFEYGSTATEYEPYIEPQEANIDLGYENLLDIQNQTISSGAGIEELNNNYFITIPKTSNYERVIWFENIKLKTNITYTITKIMELLSGTLPSVCGQLELYNGGTWIKVIQSASSTSSTFNVSTDGTYRIRLKCTDSNYSTDYKVKFSNIMLYEGTTAKTYTPYGKAIEYCKIGNYEDKFIRNSGKNLFDKEAITNGYYLNTSGGLDSNANYCVSDFIEVKAGKQYYIPVRGTTRTKYYLADKTAYSNTWDVTDTAQAITIPENVKYIRMSIAILGGTAVDINTFMFNEGSTALPYEPYGTNEWYIKKNINTYTFTGNEVYTKSGLSDETYFCGYCDTYNYQAIADIGYINQFEVGAYASITNKECMRVWGQGQVRILASRLSENSAVACQNWFKEQYDNGTPVIVYYVMTAPTYTQITGTLETQLENVYQKLLSYTGQTNISQVNNDLSFNMSVLAIEE